MFFAVLTTIVVMMKVFILFCSLLVAPALSSRGDSTPFYKVSMKHNFSNKKIIKLSLNRNNIFTNKRLCTNCNVKKKTFLVYSYRK